MVRDVLIIALVGGGIIAFIVNAMPTTLLSCAPGHVALNNSGRVICVLGYQP